MAASSAAAISVPQFVPEALAPEQERALKDAIRGRLAAENAALVAHYYTDRAVQELAEETGGCVADSLEMARFGQKHPAQTLVVAGVRFMGETAKILSPEKRVLMPTLEAECSLDLGCPPEAFSAFCDAQSGPHRGGVCQYLSRREGPGGLGGHLEHCCGCGGALEGEGGKDPLGAG